MDTKTMFSGGSWSKASFHKINRNTLVNSSSSLNALIQFITNIQLDVDYESPQDLLDMIQSQEEFDGIQNFNITHVQAAILKAFDNNSSFYFYLYDEGDCAFISFADEIAAYN